MFETLCRADGNICGLAWLMGAGVPSWYRTTEQEAGGWVVRFGGGWDTRAGLDAVGIGEPSKH